jgi:two-component system sensor histidine kinase QseC
MIRSISTFLTINLLFATFIAAVLLASGSFLFLHRDFSHFYDRRQEIVAVEIMSLVTANLQSSKPQNYLTNLQKEIGLLQNDHLFVQCNCKLPQPLSGNFNYNLLKEFEFKVWDKNGNLILHSGNFPIFNEKLELGFQDTTINKSHWRILTIYDNNTKLKLALADKYSGHPSFPHKALKDIIMALLLVIPLLGLLVWIIVKIGLRGISKVVLEVKHRAANFLTPIEIKNVPKELKSIVKELNKLFAKLELAMEREKRFAADAAHELKTPFAALKTQAQVAMHATDKDDLNKALDNIVKCVDRGTHSVQQLLILSRVIPAAFQKIPEPVNLQEIAQKIIVELFPMAKEKNIKIELIAPEKPVIILGNTSAITILVSNLVDNAIRYTDTNGSVQVVIAEEAEEIVLRVIDDGPGIPPELRKRVFERFFRIIGTNLQGTGLGLCIVQQIVQLHNGTIKLATPASGKGLEVIIIFPKSKET